MLLLILSAVVVAALAWLFLRRGKAAPAVLAQLPVAVPRPDEDDAQRREIDATTLRAARETVTFLVPDAVLADALQHTDARGLAQAFSGVDTAVLADAVGHAVPERPVATAEDLQLLRGAGQAVDDLDIWNFGER